MSSNTQLLKQSGSKRHILLGLMGLCTHPWHSGRN